MLCLFWDERECQLRVVEIMRLGANRHVGEMMLRHLCTLSHG